MTVDRRAGPPPQDGGRVVPNYAFTAGRTRSTRMDMPMEALVTATEFGCLASFCQFLHRVLVEGLHHPVSRCPAGCLGGNERPVDEPRDQVENVIGAEFILAADRLGSGQVEPTGEHGEWTKDPPLGLAQ